MKDRVVEYPHRYRDINTGQLLELVSEPGKIAEEGTPICKGTMLSNQTEEMLGMEDATPDAAMQQITALLLSGILNANTEEPREIEVGTFRNAGVGWNTYIFRKPFSSTPALFMQPQNAKGAAVAFNTVERDKFIYMLKTIDDYGVTTDDVISYLAIGGVE